MLAVLQMLRIITFPIPGIQQSGTDKLAPPRSTIYHAYQQKDKQTCTMKRDRTNLNAGDENFFRPIRSKKKRLLPIGSICPGDQTGPRVSSLLEEFSSSCSVSNHMNWLYHLRTSCAQQGCYLTNCNASGDFSHTHGAKSLVNAMTMFLSYYVPRHLTITSDDEWRELLAALRTFHMFCVRKQYVKEDVVLMSVLYKLRRFKLCQIPQRITQLFEEKYWDSLENRKEGIESNISDEDGYERYFGDETALNVEEIMADGWVINADGNSRKEEDQIFLYLPGDAASLGMKGMSLSCLQLGLRNGIWRPIEQDGTCIANAYPPDELFYY